MKGSKMSSYSKENASLNLKLKSDTPLQGLLRRREPLIVLLLIFISIALQIASGNKFLNPYNLLVMLDRKSPEAFITIGLTYLLITKDFDLSVASVMAMAGMVCAWFISQGTPVVPALIAGMIAGTLVGVLNGMIVTKFKVASFIATLGTMYIARSITQIIAQGKPISNMPEEFIKIGTFRIFGLPWYFILLIITLAILQILLKKQKSMSSLFYVGTNERASQMVGINTVKTRWVMFIVSAAIASFAGLILTAKSYSASPIAFDKLELRYIAACVIGGASISGGQGSIVGSVLGFLLIVLIGNSMTLFGVSPYWEGVIFGSVLAIAAIADSLSQKQKGR
jgi:ribose/xylose/arabinose/galactoside ABC-type transport system permease subunit